VHKNKHIAKLHVVSSNETFPTTASTIALTKGEYPNRGVKVEENKAEALN